MKKVLILLVLAFLLVSVSGVMASTYSYYLDWDGNGSDSEYCSKLGESPERTEAGWIHWVVTQADRVTAAELVLGGSGSGTYPVSKISGGVLHFFTPYYDVDTLTATLLYNGELGSNPQFNISDYCPGVYKEELTVTKTVVTSYTRTHDWSIAKSVDPTVFYLYINGSGDGTATWTIDVTYEGYEDSDFNVSGVITIENTGDLDAVITAVEDVLAGTPITVDCGVTFPYTLPVGETLTCTYDEDEYVEGKNKVTVTTEKGEYGDEKAIIWGDPTKEVNKTVTIKDYSDLFGEVTLGTVTAPNDDQFTYFKDFAWADYGETRCGDFTYKNTAKVIGDGGVVLDYDMAQLDVHVQCYIYETAYAMGNSAICFIPKFSNWGWTNQITPGTYTWDLWAGAAQCDTSKGTLVGTVTVKLNGGFDVTYNPTYPNIIKETRVYAGPTMFPQVKINKKLVDTVAPGQYYISNPINYVIAHAVVGYPDPSFGP